MWLVWILVVYLNFISTNAQFNLQEWQYRSPYQQQVAENPILFSYDQRSYPKIFMPTSFPIIAQQPVTNFIVPTTNYNTPLLAYQQEYIGNVAEMKKSSDIINSISTTKENDYGTSVHMEPNLVDFLRGTSDEVQKNFYKIVSNPDENFQQKQNKLDQLISSLDSQNQELYNNYQRMKELEEEEKRKRVHAIVAGMSHKAQSVFAKLSTVLMNPDMKDIDRMNKINDFYESVDDDVKNEFKDKIYRMNSQL